MGDLVIQKADGWVEITGFLDDLAADDILYSNDLWTWAGSGDVSKLNDILQDLRNMEFGEGEEYIEELLTMIGPEPVTNLFMVELPDDLTGSRFRVWVKKRHAPKNLELGVGLPGYNGYWITTEGEVISFPWNVSHESMARQSGFPSSRDALEAGWIRAFDGTQSNMGIEAWSILDTRSLELVAGFIETMLAEKPELKLFAIDTTVPNVVSFAVYVDEFEGLSISEAVEKDAIQALSGMRR